jgi:cytochrome c peroxidase
MSVLLKSGGVLLLAALIIVGWQNIRAGPKPWSASEVAVLRSLWLGSLAGLPPDPSNAVGDDPRAARLGEKLFLDARFSATGTISCSTCHQLMRNFTDGLPQGQAIGTSKRNTPSIVGTAFSPWLYWDGRRDSQWSQALSPLEDPKEHGSNRMQVIRVIAGDEHYREVYEALFGILPDLDDLKRFPVAAAPGPDPEWDRAWQSMTEADRTAINRAFANVGKTLAAFERTLLPAPTRFDDYVAAVIDDNIPAARLLMDNDEVLGLRLFIGEAGCTQCHNGPLLTNNEFHNTGLLSLPAETPDKGRVVGVRQVLNDPFNCRGAFSDDPERHCAELEFARTGPELIGAMRTPSLRNLRDTAPFMHKGQMDTLAEVLAHYNEAPDAMIGHNEAEPLGLSRRELRQLEAFLGTLMTRE